jgi:hypothetical protein
MCTVDEETTLLHGKKRNGTSRATNPSPFVQALKGALLVGVGVALGVLAMVVAPRGKSEGGASVHHRVGRHPRPLDQHVEPPYRPSKYKKFQPLSFEIYTGGAPVEMQGKHGNYTNHECSDYDLYGSVDGVMQCYMGHKHSKWDVEDRLAIMTDAVEKAYDLSDKSHDTLKIFVAPEFFFRGRNGAYVYDNPNATFLFNDEDGKCRAEVCDILWTLENYVAQKRFKDWLFLFGTAIVAETLPIEDNWEYLFYNFGILLRGYDPDVSDYRGKRFLVPKRYVSSSDFLTPTRMLDKNGTVEIYQTSSPLDQTVLNPHNLMHKLYDREMWHAYKDELETLGYTMIEYGWLMLDDITFSIEICLDHDLRTALTTYLADAADPKPTMIPYCRDGEDVKYVTIPRHQAQISLVSSAGMTVNPPSVALTKGGTIILQDGIEGGEADMSWAYECFKYDWAFAGGSEVVTRNTSITPTEVVFHYHIDKGYKKHSVYNVNWEGHLRGVFSSAKHEPVIVVYSPSDLAQV